MVKIITLILILALELTLDGRALLAYDPSDPASWTEAKNDNLANLTANDSVRWCKKIVAISGWKDELPQLVPLAFDDFGNSAFISTIEIEGLDWDIRLNANTFISKKIEAQKRLARQKYVHLLSLARVDCVVAMEEHGWSLAHKDQEKLVLKGETPPEDSSVESVIKWLGDHLGYSAIVLGRHKNLVLVAGNGDDLRQKNRKAIVVQNSSHQIKINARKMEGSALMSLKASSGNFAIFSVIRESRSSLIQPGDKVILE